VAAKRIGIAGAGVLGRLLAFTLSRAGHAVQVFDPASGPGPRADSGSLAAGWTAAGMLSPVAELERAGAEVFALGLRSCALWPQIVQSLQQPVELRMQGSLLLAHRSDAGAAQRVVGLLQSKADAAYHPQTLSPDELRELEPAVQGPALAWLLPWEGQIHPIQAMQALAAQGTEQGVQWHWNCRVAQVDACVLHVVDASTPVRVELVEALRQAQGERHQVQHSFDHVFDVRGVGAKPDIPVRGVRGEVFWLHAPGVPLLRPVRLLHPRHSVYLVPRPDDVIVVGASEIESEDRSPVSLRSTLELLSAAHSAIPALAEARVVHTETNLRPALPNNLPALRHAPGLTVINGLFRHGWLIAPALVEQALQELSL
jgi:glycine oxidase